jgi:4-diphosphocytidyl-2-C-methyl-D-erythritol kinase
LNFTEIAFAKINLALHVRRKREDGYHEIETVFAFVDAGDVLHAEPAERDRLSIHGEFGRALEDPFGNSVTEALGALPRPTGLAITLEKNLPVAAGLGGGSADAGAVFRLIERIHGLPEDWRERAAALGADVPACVASVTCIGRGIGTELEPVEGEFSGMPVLLVNPRVTLSTAAVYGAWDGVDRGPLPQGDLTMVAWQGRNDLEQAAIGLCPEIAVVLKEVRDTQPWFARMSGSGATCFGLFETEERLLEARRRLAAAHPGWWQMQGKLR